MQPPPEPELAPRPAQQRRKVKALKPPRTAAARRQDRTRISRAGRRPRAPRAPRARHRREPRVGPESRAPRRARPPALPPQAPSDRGRTRWPLLQRELERPRRQAPALPWAPAEMPSCPTRGPPHSAPLSDPRAAAALCRSRQWNPRDARGGRPSRTRRTRRPSVHAAIVISGSCRRGVRARPALSARRMALPPVEVESIRSR